MTSIILGMSGGVDSSVSALLLKDAGFEVIGVTIRMFDNCVEKASEIANRLNIKHIVIDKKDLFQDNVINYFINSYKNAKTPNPCVKCNRLVKFKTLFDIKKKLSADFVATGHYAVVNDGILYSGTDKSKDQSYFLYYLNREYIKEIIFPLGKYLKSEIKEIARRNNLGFESIKESSDICFLNKCENYRDFIDSTPIDGDVLDENGNIIGCHKGIINYTIGQRKGVGIACGEPMYVKSIDPRNNTITLAKYSSLFVNTIKISEVNLLRDVSNQLNDVKVKLRYTKSFCDACVNFYSDFTSAIVKLKESEYGVAPGQSCVIYDGDVVIGGGVIEFYE